jgi:hypothetical protein
MMSLQCRTAFVLIAALFVPTSARILGGAQHQLRASSKAPISDTGIMKLLLQSESDPTSKEFKSGCLQTTKALVAENDGSKKGVAAQLELICSGLQLPLDVEICNRYRSTLLGHLHRKALWNLGSMDFTLFCNGMQKVVTKFNADLVAFSAGKKVGVEAPLKATEEKKEEDKKEPEKDEDDEKPNKEKLLNKKEQKPVEAKLVKKEEADDDADDDDADRTHGSDDCRCIGIDELDGETVIALKKKNVSYPADLGARCEKWDHKLHPDCKGKKPKEWCAQAWCYVDPCKCKKVADLPKPSAYLPDAKYQGKPVHYSYATCGGKDMYSAEDEKATAKDLEKTCAIKVNPAVWGAANCRCVGIGPQPGSTNVSIKGEQVPFPADVGATCTAWEKDNHPECDGDKAPDWCSQKWCYVDPCSCKLPTPPKTSSYVPEANYQGKPVYYSYATCGGKDSYTDGRKEACVNQKSNKACSKLKKCAWTGKECLGKELVEVCNLEPEQEPKGLKGAAWSTKAFAAIALPLLACVY